MGIITYAQNFEDVMLHRVFGGVHYGFYVDLGAHDPVVDSVTKAFYDRGWDGINVEPGNLFDKLAQARPRDINLRLAVYDRQGEITFAQHDAVLSGLSHVQEGDASPSGPGIVDVHKVPCDTLTNILARYAPRRPIAFMKIDVEGAEGAIIRSTDWRAIRPTVLVIEATVPRSNKLDNADWERVLLGQGYVRAWFDGLNCFYVPSERRDLLEHFVLPVNVLDGYMRPNPRLDAAEARLAGVPALEAEVARLRAEVDRLGTESAQPHPEALRLGAELARAEEATAAEAGRAARARSETERLRFVARAAEQLAAHVRHDRARAREEAVRTTAELDGARRELDGRTAALADLAAELAAANDALARANLLVSDLLAQRTLLQEQRLHLRQRAEIAEFRFAELTGSTVWRAGAPFREAGRLLSAPVRSRLRGGLVTAWRASTPWRAPTRLRVRLALAELARAALPPEAAQGEATQAEPAQDGVGHAALPEPPAAPVALPVLPPPVLPAVVVPPPAPSRFDLSAIGPTDGDMTAALDWYDPFTPDVSIVVLNWNRGAMTRLCLQHVLRHTAGHRYEIVVVDNGSHPADLQAVRDEVPMARFIPLNTNKFFGEANNIGAEAARGRLLCFLNNDAFVSPGWLSPLVDALEAEPGTGAAGPRFLYPDGRLQEAGGLIGPDGFAEQLGKNRSVDDPTFAQARPVDYVSAACLLLRRSDFLRVLGFDLAWDPAYFEDVDLCFKLRLLGLRTLYCPGSTVRHVENATSVTEGAALNLPRVVDVNRGKFVARWGRYMETLGRERPDLVPSPPAPLPKGGDGLRVLIFTPYDLTPGGGERYILSLAEAFRGEAAAVALVTTTPVSRVRLLTMGREFGLALDHLEPLVPADLADRPPFDVAFVLGNEILPVVGRMARRSIFICQFPFPIESDVHAARVRPFWHDVDMVVCYSAYVKDHIGRAIAGRRLPYRPVEVLAPPVPQLLPGRRKNRRQILHVGRFFTGGHCKRQDRLIEVFRSMVASGVEAELHLAGSTMPQAEHMAYFSRLVVSARGLPVHFHPNCSPAELRDLYAGSAIYWHATGLGADVAADPHAVEHFGITVVEAMSARCVPVVFQAGGPAEVVEDGVTGFHFTTEAGLARRTREVLDNYDTPQVQAMADAAAAAASRYAEPVFREEARRHVRRVLDAWTVPTEAG